MIINFAPMVIDLPYFPVWLALLSSGCLAYLEMHYRWWPIPSRFFRREPDIIADLPFRLEPGQELPLMLLVKDADSYPCHMDKISITIHHGGRGWDLPEIEIDASIKDRWWHKIIPVELPVKTGTVKVFVTMHYTVRGKERTCLTHNIRLVRPQPLVVELAEHSFPGENVLWGDLHHHTCLTEDMIEFGAPLDATQIVATAAGLDFVALTDHSYDLDDLPGSWTKTDPELTKWNGSRLDISALNGSGNGATMIPGEEVSIRNGIGKTVHALVLNHPEYLPGSGDGGEHLFHLRCELSADDIAEQTGPDSLIIAAHPYYPTPFLEWLLLGRGLWEDSDILNDRVAGLQILSGRIEAGFIRGVEEWRRWLLMGERKFIYAGTDSHGDFNQRRAIKRPFVTISEGRMNYLGGCRTGLIDTSTNDIQTILGTLRQGRCIISNGPYLNMVAAASDQVAAIGGELTASKVTITLNLSSTQEFGPLAGFRLMSGHVGDAKEEILLEEQVEGSRFEYSWSGDFDLKSGCTYFRAEVESWLAPIDERTPPAATLAMTNPIWVTNTP